MKTGLILGVGAIAVVAVAASFYMVDIEQTEETALPDVDVNVEGGNMPEFDAEVGSVDVVDETMTVDVPEVEVTTREEEVTVPTLEVQPPGDDDMRAAERVETEDGTAERSVQ